MDKKVIKITESNLEKIVRSSLKRIAEEIENGNLSFNNNNGINVEFIERDKILSIIDTIWELLSISYENIGGLKTYKSKNQFAKIVKYAKIAYYNGEIVACAIYRKMEDSFKMVAIGCNQEEIGKEGLQSIVKDDIIKVDYHFWAEVSGAIEHYFKKYNGYPMPNILASKILQVSEESIRFSSKDLEHYERLIADEWYEKMIFGIKNEEIFQEALKAVDDYSKFMREVNKISEKIKNGFKYTLKQAIYIVENIYRAHEEDGFNELVPSWYEALCEAKKTLVQSEKTQTIVDYIEYCDYLLETMPILTLHTLSV
ncbi:MAG: hypothetical protein J6X10_01305 [Bacteroidales bacterium]|nr:hypothetical protein [Bacteroidales bacterium]